MYPKTTCQREEVGELIDCFPNARPSEPPSGSPARGRRVQGSIQEAEAAMEKLLDLMSRDLMSQAAAIGLATLKEHRASIGPCKNFDMDTVGMADSSTNVSVATKVKVLIVYFTFNLGLTLFSKAIMVKFPFPFLLTTLHAAAGCIGTGVMATCGMLKLRTLTKKDFLTLCGFSLLYTVNIAISNVSLSMVSIPFHQVLRATTPAFTVAIYHLYYSKTYSFDTYISLIPTIAGVGLATYGDYDATPLGFFMTLLGAILAAIKTVITNRMQTAGLRLGAMELLYRMSPLATIQSLAMVYFTGEFNTVRQFLQEPDNASMKTVLILSINAAMAFGLNVSSFTANKQAGALTMTVAANVKQILTMLLSVIFWHLKINAINCLGIVMTLVGGAWYTYFEFRSHNAVETFRLTRANEAIVEGISQAAKNVYGKANS